MSKRQNEKHVRLVQRDCEELFCNLKELTAYWDIVKQDAEAERERMRRLEEEVEAFKQMKIGHFLMRLQSLVAHLQLVYPDSSITLYGSCARGEDDQSSDIELLVITRRKTMAEPIKFEKQLGRKITLLVYEPREWEEKARKDPAFYERILIDGIALKGNMPVAKL